MKKIKYPILITRGSDGEAFIHLGKGGYRTKWSIMNGSISITPFEAFDKNLFTFYYK